MIGLEFPNFISKTWRGFSLHNSFRWASWGWVFTAEWNTLASLCLLLSLLALSAFHVGDIFKCLVFFGCSLIFKSRTQSLCVPGCFYLRVGFIKIDGSILCIPWKERIYSLGSFNYYREEFSSLFFWKHLRMVWSERTRGFHFSLHRFSLNLSMRCPVLYYFLCRKIWCNFPRE